METRFKNRQQAGQFLGDLLSKRLTDSNDVIVLALPRGGVPVGYEVAQRLGAPLDVFVVRKLGVPGHEELAMGAIASGGVRVLNQRVVQFMPINQAMIERVVARETEELRRREQLYRGDRPPPEVEGKTVILIDDGLATGATMRAAAEALRQRRPRRLIVAVPVAAPETCEEFRGVVDEIVCGRTPEDFVAVGMWYQDFSQTTDEEVRELLQHNAAEHPAPTAAAHS